MTLDMKRVALAAALIAPVHVASSQSLASRVAAVRDGVLEMHYAGRPGLCGDGAHYLSFGGRSRMGELSGDDGATSPCLPGPVRVRLRVQDGVVRGVRAYAGPLHHPRGDTLAVTDLGAVPAHAAADYFLQLAAGGERREASEAIVAAVLADSAVVWPSLVAIARDAARPRSTRIDASFWLSRFAAARLAGHAEDLAAADDGDEARDQNDTRGAAVFALSQLRNGEGIEPLITVARTNHDPRLRRQALFWLSQSGDPRGVDVMEEMLK